MSERLGFLGVFGSPRAKLGIRGGLLITDDRGAPLEIQVTSPVKPSLLQRAVHGRPLERKVIVELIAGPLLSAPDYCPRLVLTNHHYCLAAESRFPLFFVSANHDAAGVAELETKIVQAGDGSFTIVEGRAAQRMMLNEAHSLMTRAARYFEPLEVFSRIENTMNVLAEQHDRFH